MWAQPRKRWFKVKGATIRFPGGGGGQEYLSRANYLFQPGSAARWKFHILLHVYMEKFLKQIIYLTQSLPEIIYFKNTPAPPPWESNGGPLSWYWLRCFLCCSNGPAHIVHTR